MAKDEQTAVTPVAPAGALAKPSFIPSNDRRGSEHITKQDMALPRLQIAQGLSPELLEGDPKYIKDLKLGEMFNTLTKEIYGRGPFDVVIVRADRPRGIVFKPRSEGGGILDMDVKPNDPRMDFGANGEKPIATKFYEYIMLKSPINPVSPMESLICLSLKSSGLKTAKRLNGLIKMRTTPLFSMLYTITAGQEKNQHGQYGVFKIEQAGYIQDEAVYKAAEYAFDAIKDIEFQIEREPGDDTADAADDIPDLTGETEM